MPKLLLPVSLLLVSIGIDETFSFFGTPLLVARNFSGSEIGLLFAAFFAGALFFILPAGFLSDRIRIKHLAAFGFASTLLLFLTLQKTNNFWLLFLVFILGGAGLNIAKTVLDILYYKLIQPEKRGHSIAMLNLKKGFTHGVFVIGIGFLASTFVLNIFLKIFIILSAITFFLSFFLPSNETFQTTTTDYRAELRNPVARIFLIIAILFFFHGGMDGISAPYLWREEMGLAFWQIGLLGGLPLIIIYNAIQLTQAHHTHKHKIIRNYAIMGLIFSALGHVVIGFTYTFWGALIGRSIHILGDSLFFLFFTTELAWLYSKKTIGGQFGIFTLAILLSGAASRIFVGQWGELYGFRSTLFISAGVMLVTAAYVYSQRVAFSPRE